MKKGKEFIFPENVDKDYGIWMAFSCVVKRLNIFDNIKNGVDV